MRDVDRPPGQSNDLLARHVRTLESISTLLRLITIAAAGVVLVAVLGEVVMIIFATVLIAVMLRGAAARIGRVAGIGTGWRRNVLHELPFGLGKSDDGSTGFGGRIGSAFPHMAGAATSALWSVVLGVLGTIGVILVAALYMAAAPQPYVQGVAYVLPKRWLPKRWRPTAQHVLDRIGHDLWGWLLGQFFDMLIVGTLCGVGLALLGMPLAFILAVIAGLLNFAPYIGAITGAVPALVVAFALGGREALFVALLYLGVQLFEGNVTAPLIQRRAIKLPPSLTILSQTALGMLFGVFKIILATPVTAAFIAAVQALEDENPDY